MEGGGGRRGKGLRGCDLERGWVWATCSWRLEKGELRQGRGGGWRWRGLGVGKVGRVWNKGRRKREEKGLLGQGEGEKKMAVESLKSFERQLLGIERWKRLLFLCAVVILVD